MSEYHRFQYGSFTSCSGSIANCREDYEEQINGYIVFIHILEIDLDTVPDEYNPWFGESGSGYIEKIFIYNPISIITYIWESLVNMVVNMATSVATFFITIYTAVTNIVIAMIYTKDYTYKIIDTSFPNLFERLHIFYRFVGVLFVNFYPLIMSPI